MGFLDKLKQEASDVASTVAEKTQEVARSGPAPACSSATCTATSATR